MPGLPTCLSCTVCFADVHTEAVQAALAKQRERGKMAVPMPSKRRSLVVQSSMDAYTPPGEEHIGHQGNHSSLGLLHCTVYVCGVCVRLNIDVG